MTTIRFIADLHLDPERPQIIALFIHFLNELSPAETDALYILGDLFEAWIGDDNDDPALIPVLDALASLADRDIPLYVMHGNRDFLLGDAFTRRTRATLLDENTLITLHGRPTLLLHGDSLCTDDRDYQAFRAQVRDPAWQADFLSKPLEERRQIAAHLRATSQEQNQLKAEAIMDVNPNTVKQVLRNHGVTRMIHGHTHRPAIHHFELDGKPAERMVVGDWYEQGSCLECDAGGCRLVRVQTPDNLPAR